MILKCFSSALRLPSFIERRRINATIKFCKNKNTSKPFEESCESKSERKNYAKEKQSAFIPFQRFTGFCVASLIKRLTRTVKERFCNLFKQVEIHFANTTSQLTLTRLQNLRQDPCIFVCFLNLDCLWLPFSSFLLKNVYVPLHNCFSIVLS